MGAGHKKCPSCGGKGKVENPEWFGGRTGEAGQTEPGDKPAERWQTCYRCYGAGVIQRESGGCVGLVALLTFMPLAFLAYWAVF